jgi:hypothetical protein
MFAIDVKEWRLENLLDRYRAGLASRISIATEASCA